MVTSPPTGTWVRERSRPALIRVVGALTMLAVAGQVGASLGIDAWLEQTLFALASPDPPTTAIAPGVWATHIGTVPKVAMLQLEHVMAQAEHYRLLSMAIAWTTAASAAVLWMKVDEQPIVQTTTRRPAQPVALLAPAAI